MTRYSYDRTASATPSFDAAAKAKLDSKLGQLVDKASKAADKAEDLVDKIRAGGFRGMDKLQAELKKTATVAQNAAYGILDLLRPVQSKGNDELSDLRESKLEVVKFARQLVQSLKELDTEHYGTLMLRWEDKTPSDIARAIHALSMQAQFVASTYRQFREAFENHH